MQTVLSVIRQMEALSQRKRGFSLVYYTCSHSRGDKARSGERVEVHNVVLSNRDRTLPANVRRSLTQQATAKAGKRNPWHDEHGTVNIHVIGSREIRSVHTWLITEFNGQPVL